MSDDLTLVHAMYVVYGLFVLAAALGTCFCLWHLWLERKER